MTYWVYEAGLLILYKAQIAIAYFDGVNLIYF